MSAKPRKTNENAMGWRPRCWNCGVALERGNSFSVCSYDAPNRRRDGRVCQKCWDEIAKNLAENQIVTEKYADLGGES